MATIEIAENKLIELEQRIQSVESNNKINSKIINEKITNSVHDIQLNMLERLKEIRIAMDNEQINNVSTPDVINIIAERDNALLQLKKAQNEIDKLNYRIKHLVKELNIDEQ